MQEKFMESLTNASKALQTADHLTYITFPLIKEKRLLLKILSELHVSIISAINSMLQFEFYYKRIHLFSDPKENFNTFKKVAQRYNIPETQVKNLVDIITLAEKHKKSPFEFVKNDKIVIMSQGMQSDTLNLEKIKAFLLETKDFLRKVSIKVKGGGL